MNDSTLQPKITNAQVFFLLSSQYEDHRDNFYERVDADAVFRDFKQIVYDPKSYKWSITSCLKFLTNLTDVKPANFLAHLQELNNKLNNNKNIRGKVGFEKFIFRLKSSNKFMYSKYDFYGIKLNDDVDTFEFIRDLKILHKHLDISQNNFIKFVFKNFQTGFTESTFRRYYYDEVK